MVGYLNRNRRRKSHCVEIDFHKRRVVRVSNPRGPGFPGADQIFAEVMHEDPILDYQRRSSDGQALRISDFVTLREFHRTRLYNEFHRRLGADRQIAFRLDATPSLNITIGLNRTQANSVWVNLET